MILKRLVVDNFRQFRGNHTVDFAIDQNKNLTLILGYNTFGKSALLNAINFALYGVVQEDLDHPTALLNQDAEAKGEKQFSISLDFEFQGSNYHVQRDRIFTYHAGGKKTFVDQVELHQIEAKSGSWIPVPHYQQLINRAIPQEMAPHFIFHGEKRINQFATGGTHKEVGDAIRKILGCNVIEVGIEDLHKIYKKLERVVVKQSGDHQMEDLQRCGESLEAQLADVEQKIQRKEDEIDAAQIELEKISQQLRDHDRTKELQRQLERAEGGKKSAEDNRDKTQKEILRWLKDSAIVVSSAAVAQGALDAIDEEEVRGKFPSEYQESFIRALLDAQICICQRKIQDGSPEWDAVMSLLEHGGKKDVLDMVLKVKAGAERYTRSLAKAKNDLSLAEERLKSIRSEIGSYDRDIQEYKQRLAGVNVAELSKKAARQASLKLLIKELSEQIGDLSRKKKVQIEPDIRRVREDIERKLRSRPELDKKRRVLDVVTELGLFLNDQLQKYEETAREKVLQLTNENLSVMHRDKEAFFDAKFNLGLREKDTKLQGGKSTGESQLLVLAFTSALIKFCSQREEDKNEFLIPGTIAPLVLDAPFGQLDTTFQKGAISWIPKMARQVILFVSDSQSRILQESGDTMERVGACYAIQIPRGVRETPPYVISNTPYISYNSRTDGSTSLLRIW